MSDQPSSQNADSARGGRPALPFREHLSRAMRRTLFCSYMTVLLVFVSIGIAAGFLGWPVEPVFFLNFLAITLLAPIIEFSIDELALGVGHAFGRLMKSISGNAVEMIVGTIAVSRGQVQVAQSSLLGSILSYALLVLGCSFFVAGYDKKKVIFDKTLTNTMSSLMMAVCICLIIPTIMAVTSSSETTPYRIDRDILILSRAIAIALLILCITYLYFQFSTHAWVLHAPDDNSAGHENHQNGAEAHSRSIVALLATSCILMCSVLCVIICAYHLVGSVNGLAKALDINKTFIGLVLIPPTGYSVKSITIIAMARRCQMRYVMRTVVTDILQITLFIIPFLILFGWLIKEPFTLDFNVFKATVFFLTLIVMTSAIQDGTTNYFDGIMLVGTYVLIAVAFYVRPDVAEKIVLPVLHRKKVV